MKIIKGKKTLFKTVKTAESFMERFTGLLGKKNIPDGFTMFFPSCNSIHTWFMQTAIDVIMIDRQGQVVLALKNLQPWKTAVCIRAADTLEMRAGAITALKLAVGDKLTIKQGS